MKNSLKKHKAECKNNSLHQKISKIETEANRQSDDDRGGGLNGHIPQF